MVSEHSSFDGCLFVRQFLKDAHRVYDGLGALRGARPEQSATLRVKALIRLEDTHRWAKKWTADFQAAQANMTFHLNLMEDVTACLVDLEKTTSVMLQHHGGVKLVDDIDWLVATVQAEVNKMLDCAEKAFRYFNELERQKPKKSFGIYRDE